jgi:hypothetical protein
MLNDLTLCSQWFGNWRHDQYFAQNLPHEKNRTRLHRPNMYYIKL